LVELIARLCRFSARDVDPAKCVTLSALVHSATLPGAVDVLSVWVNSITPFSETKKRFPSARKVSVCQTPLATFVFRRASSCRPPAMTR
jgi:hypothetical protein